MLDPLAISRRLDRLKGEVAAVEAMLAILAQPTPECAVEALVAQFRYSCLAEGVEWVDIGSGAEERVWEDVAACLVGRSPKTLRNWRLDYDDPLLHLRHRDERNVERETYLLVDLARYVIAHPRKFGTGARTGEVRPTNGRTVSEIWEAVKMHYTQHRYRDEDLAPGVRFARFVKCKGLARLKMVTPLEVAQVLYGHDQVLQQFIKGDIAAGSVGGSTWGHQLVGDETDVYTDFVDFLRPRTIVGKFGTNGIPALHPAIFRTALLGQTAGGTGHWVGEGKPIPLTKQAFSRTTLDALKVAAITPITKELLQRSAPAADVMIRDDLAKSLGQRMDLSFIDPGNAGEAGISPASITSGLTPVASTGNDADAIRADLARLFAEFDAVEQPLDDAVFIMSSALSRKLSLMRNAFGVKEFPGLTVNGGSLEGLPIITSNTLAPDTGGHMVVLVNASDIWLGDEGGVEIDVADQASLNMVDNPTTPDAVTPMEAEMVSLWQTEALAFRAKREVNWKKRRPTAAAYLNNVNWGGTGS